ncbi:MAG TPA: hypothetical protein VHY19_13070 [Steroidobacteraceae bacterium]|jgi:hypothetical protein|nr:hypothetical protein [Steroidobacteraceae bacterium]
MLRPLEDVREQLLRAGISPRYANRYVRELGEHLADLTDQALASGLDADAAGERARAMLGGDALMARAVIDNGAPRSFAARAPWVVLVALPALLLMAAILANVFWTMHLLRPVHGLTPAQILDGYRGLLSVMSFVVSYLVAALLAVGCLAVALRQRLASGWLWVGLILISLLSGILGFHRHVTAPYGGRPGGPMYSVAAIVYLHGRASLAATLGVALLHAGVLFAMAATAYRVLRTHLIPGQKACAAGNN